MRKGTNERTNERTYTTTKRITTLLLHSQVKTENFNAYKKQFFCTQLSCTYKEKIKTQTTRMYNNHIKISKTNFLK